MTQEDKGFFTQKTFNIFFFGVFIFIMAMMYKEHREMPENYLSDVKDSEVYVKNILSRPIFDTYGKPVYSGYKSRSKHIMWYSLGTV